MEQVKQLPITHESWIQIKKKYINEGIHQYKWYRQSQWTGGALLFQISSRGNYIWTLDANAIKSWTTCNNWSNGENMHHAIDSYTHKGIDGNKATDKLPKKARDLHNTTSLVTLDDANVIACYWLKEKTIRVDQQISQIVAIIEIKKTVTRLRTGHFGGMKINAGNIRIYVKYRNCHYEKLSPTHIFSSPSVQDILQNIGAYSFDGTLYTENIVDLARTITKAHGSIWLLVGHNTNQPNWILILFAC